ncbi:hypothetical protein [Amycolatopsis thermoflava]|uniref:hypothetical protein n=1 Tax=Amycolatopsis thermoflava TaxID=84480 RepID=UPI0003FDB41D|nr:hypothetical protein [Amycolatopsis thermoflava]
MTATAGTLGESPQDAVHVIRQLGGPDLVAERAARGGAYPARHRLADVDADTAVLVDVPEILRLASELDEIDAVTVALVHRAPNGPCTWCQIVGRPAAVTVYGDPAPTDDWAPLEMAETCLACAPRAVHQAVIEQNPDSAKHIAVEIAVPAHPLTAPRPTTGAPNQSNQNVRTNR